MQARRVSWYHSTLRVSAVILAVTLIFDSGLFNPVTAELSQTTQSYLANAVGVTVGVAPTELNTITAELTARERALEEREAALEQREIDVGVARQSGSVAAGTNTSTYILAALLFVILLLLVLNYAMDFARARRLQEIAS